MNIPSPLVLLVSEYVIPSKICTLRDICKGIRQVLDESNPEWENTLNNYMTPKRILYKGSVGTTALLVRSSLKYYHCVCCGSNEFLSRNEYYNIIICKQCRTNKYPFVEVNLRTACLDFFLDFSIQKQNNTLIKVRNGRSFRVLKKHILKIAQETYPDGELQEKIDRRYFRNQQTILRRKEAKDKRIRLIKSQYRTLFNSNNRRIDSDLSNIEFLSEIIHKHRCYNVVFGDVNSLLIKTKVTPEEASLRLCDFSMMITYMAKKGLLDAGLSESGSGTNAYYIYMKYCMGGLHFYEMINDYADSLEETRKRTTEVERFLLTTRTRKERKSLAIALCVEDCVDYDEYEFRSFVEIGNGNPVYIARSIRHKVFLNQNNFIYYLDNFLYAGYTYTVSIREATNRVLDNTMGYPAMKRTCHINLTF